MLKKSDLVSAEICGSIAAHARAINSIDFNDAGLLVSVGDDSFIRIWRLIGDADNLQVNLFFNEISFRFVPFLFFR